MQRLRGEITVFLSLILVCVFSLMMGLLESARTAGARLYLQMAADSALFSVMSQYNRNLWDRYRLLFLEYEAEEDLLASFEQYLGFYLEQDQFYPARLEAAEITELVKAGDAGGAFLEQEILSYIQYRLPEVAGDLAGIAKEAAEAAKAGDFQTLLTVCRQTGERTKGLEKARMELEQSLEAMEHAREKTEKAAKAHSAGALTKRRAAWIAVLVVGAGAAYYVAATTRPGEPGYYYRLMSPLVCAGLLVAGLQAENVVTTAIAISRIC